MKKYFLKSNRKPLFGNRRSHALNATRHKFKLNFVYMKIMDENNMPKKIKLTAREFRTMKKHNKIYK